MGTLSLSEYEDVSIWVPWGHISGRWYGNRKERPILAIHGYTDNLGTFDRLIPLLPDYLGVLCIDLPGHGCSSGLPPGIQYTFVEWSYVINRIMRQFKWSKVSLMGHSMGGVMGFLHTCLAPHTVDFIITIEAVLNPVGRVKDLSAYAFNIDKFVEEVERSSSSTIYEANSHTLQHFCDFLNVYTFESVPTDRAQHLLNRVMHRSQLYPDKFYLLRDNRTKFVNDFVMTPELGTEMARRIRNKPYLIIKGSDSHYITDNDYQVITILRDQNPQFEFHEVPGKHHVHLSNAEDCAKYIIPFLRQHRPPPKKEETKHRL
ncbi:probable serine hydrolase [Drosophila innubila]|uniref:probable serine hydrolase n=1 Tax=Drosophila innubila TaxID=198719 RepID=UPI00148D4F07|nr:probable serine hydrolase [Drosophila innubila]